jgi:hypothetical protein
MWTIDSASLPDQETVAVETLKLPLATLDPGFSSAPLARLSEISRLSAPGVVGVSPTTALVSLGAITSDSVTVDLPDEIHPISITHNGTPFAIAADPADPQPYEFTTTGGTATLYAPASTFISSLPAVVLGAQSPTGEIPTDAIDPSLFSVFYGLPVSGEIEWECNFEDHPSGSFKL